MTSPQSSLDLLPCDYREPTDSEGVYFCRHAQVRVARGLVTGAICQLCSMREKPCLVPRDPHTLPEPSGPDTTRPIGVPLRPPSLVQQGWNLAQSLAAFTADGLKTVTPEQYEQRLAICDSCDKRVGTRCMQCGCGLALKAKGRAFTCPVKKWPVLTAP